MSVSKIPNIGQQAEALCHLFSNSWFLEWRCLANRKVIIYFDLYFSFTSAICRCLILSILPYSHYFSACLVSVVFVLYLLSFSESPTVVFFFFFQFVFFCVCFSGSPLTSFFLSLFFVAFTGALFCLFFFLTWSCLDYLVLSCYFFRFFSFRLY